MEPNLTSDHIYDILLDALEQPKGLAILDDIVDNSDEITEEDAVERYQQRVYDFTKECLEDYEIPDDLIKLFSNGILSHLIAASY